MAESSLSSNAKDHRNRLIFKFQHFNEFCVPLH